MGAEPSGSRFRDLFSFQRMSASVQGPDPEPGPGPGDTLGLGGGSGSSVAAVEEAKFLLRANVFKFCDTSWICFLHPVQSAGWSPGL